jgi:DNA end-binding protein Ku
MARAIWKGAISFGLVHIPVALVSATTSHGIDFDWLDKRSMEPVGYQRINKATGKTVAKEDVVKGVQYERGHYVVLSDTEIREALPKLTQTIDIFAFVDSREIPLPLFDTPYYLAPDHRGEKVYALLRETLVDTGKVALAQVVIRTRQHLAALMPMEESLTLMVLRWPSEVRDLSALELNGAAQPKLTAKERGMARQLVEEMSSDWQPGEYRDTFADRINELVEEKARAGRIETVDKELATEPRRSADIIDLAELLKRSLSGGKGKARTTRPKAERAATPARKRQSAAKKAAKSPRTTTRKAGGRG